MNLHINILDQDNDSNGKIPQIKVLDENWKLAFLSISLPIIFCFHQ